MGGDLFSTLFTYKGAIMDEIMKALGQELKMFNEKFATDYSANESKQILKYRKNEHKSDIRDEFQRDRDRIIHSRAFRRLNGKTQVFNATKGDHYRTRLTHSLEVSQISRTIGKALGLHEDLIEAIALGHDLGHTPFGHVIERTLHDILKHNEIESIKIKLQGGFKHNFQSIHLVDNIEMGNNDTRGLNLTTAVRDGILKHTGVKIKSKYLQEKEEVSYECIDFSAEGLSILNYKHSITLEGQIVALADEIAQSTHDLEDGVRAKAIKMEDLIKEMIKEIDQYLNELKKMDDDRQIRLLQLLKDDIKRIEEDGSRKLGLLIKDLINTFIIDALFNSIERIKAYDEKYKEPKDKVIIKESLVDNSKYIKELRNFISNYIFRHVVSSQEVAQLDSKARYLIKQIFKAYYEDPRQLPDYALVRYYDKIGRSLDRTKISDETKELQESVEFVRLICDHIAGMTDLYAMQEYNKLYGTIYNI